MRATVGREVNLTGPFPQRAGEKPPHSRIKAVLPLPFRQPTTKTTFSFDLKFAFSPLNLMSNAFDRCFNAELMCASLVAIPLAFLEG